MVRAGVHLIFLLGLVWSLIGSWVPLCFEKEQKGRKRSWKASFLAVFVTSERTFISFSSHHHSFIHTIMDPFYIGSFSSFF